ncbi:hypothetical protein AB4Y77_02000 [Paenarthrobacter sp. YAF11_1]|uniref:hypothetical protein n=1 Tax=Paenarthrobacter sp. YAF11_1 TaxID=3233074 RepID=UPI003F97E9C0
MTTEQAAEECKNCTEGTTITVRQSDNIPLCQLHWNAWLSRYAVLYEGHDQEPAPCGAHLAGSRPAAAEEQDDNADQPPGVDVHDSSRQLPPAKAAAERVRKFVGHFGDGEIFPEFGDRPALYARDLEAVAASTLEPMVATLEEVWEEGRRAGWSERTRSILGGFNYEQEEANRTPNPYKNESGG